jgi:hypothetical protein
MVSFQANSGTVSELRADEGDLGPPVLVSGAATGDEHRSTQAPSAGAPDPKTDPAFRAWAEMRALAGKPLLLRCIKA